MKTKKNYFKVAICFLAFAVCSFLLAFSPTMTAIAAIDYTLANYNLAINSMRMPITEVNANKDDFLIPLLDTTFSDPSFKNFVRVIDPTGTSHDYEIGGTNTDSFFGSIRENQALPNSDKVKDYLEVKSKNNGEYKIVYILKSDSNIYYSNTYTVNVTGVSYSLDFTDAEGMKAILPTIVAKDNSTITLPVANVVDAEGNVKTTINPVVSKNNKILTGAEDTDDLTNRVLKFSKDPDGTSDADKAEDNIYTITYSYDDGSNHLVKTFTIKASNNFKGTGELRLASTPKMPSITLGQKGIELPKLAVKNDTDSNVEYNLVSIEIYQQGNPSIKQTLGANEYTFDMTADAFEGNASYAKMYEEKTYNVRYTIKDAYEGKDPLVKEFSFEVGAPANPTVYMSYDYTVNAEGKVENGGDIELDAKAEVKSVYGVNSIVIPAIYGTDVISKYEDSNFILVRYLENGVGTRYYIDNINLEGNAITSSNSGYNHSDDANIGKLNKAVAFKFTNNSANESDYLGEYELHYRAISKDITGSKSSRYTDVEMAKINVVSTSDAESLNFVPTVSIDNIVNNSNIKSNTEIAVRVKAEDNAASSSVDAKYADKSLKTALMYYYAAENADFESDLNTAIKAIDLVTGYNKTSHVFDNADLVDAMSTKYANFGIITESENNEFKFTANGNNGQVTIVAVTMNDQSVIDIDSKTLTIKDITDDEVPEKVDMSYDGVTVTAEQERIEFAVNSTDPMPKNIFEQGKEVVLPKITFNESELQMSVAYYVVEDATELGKIKYQYPTNVKYKNGNTVYGGVITTDKIGTYNVVYTATDVAGNTSVVFVSFEVADSSNPILSVKAIGNGLTQSGNVITAEKGTEISLEALLHSSDMKTNLTDIATIDVDIQAQNLGYEPTGTTEYSYKFNSVGSYAVTINASYYDDVFGKVRNAETKEYVINITPIELKWTSEFDVDEFVDKEGEKVYLPMVSATDDAEVNVIVKKKNGKELVTSTETDTNGATRLVFVPADKGIYTVTYTATSDDAKITKTFDIKVGDHIAPTIKMNYESELSQDIIYKGKDISYKFNVVTTNSSTQTRKFVITASSNGKTIYEYDLGLSISDRDASGQVTEDYPWTSLDYSLTTENGKISGTKPEYTISGTGKYTLTLTVDDGVYGNVATKVITFNVVDETEAKEENDTVVGTVLIVVSLVVLAGVILFFLFTGKKGKGTKSKKTKKIEAVEESSSDEQIVIEDVDTNDKQ